MIAWEKGNCKDQCHGSPELDLEKAVVDRRALWPAAWSWEALPLPSRAPSPYHLSHPEAAWLWVAKFGPLPTEAVARRIVSHNALHIRLIPGIAAAQAPDALVGFTGVQGIPQG